MENEQQDSLVRFGISMNAGLLERFDRTIAHKGYTNRSEAIRDLVRDYIVETDWEKGDSIVAGSITLVYDHHVRGITDALIDLQHDHHDIIVSTVHVHLDHDYCLEVLVVKGKAKVIKEAADKLISTKGVKHGRLSITSSGGLP